MDANKFAAYVTRIEGKCKSLSIAQVKEVLSIIRKLLLHKGVDIYRVMK